MLKPKNFFYVFIICLVLIELGLIVITLIPELIKEKELEDIFFLDQKDAMIDTLIMQMSLKQKIGQLVLFELEGVKSKDKEIIDSIIQQNHLGGVKFKQTEVFNQLIVTNYIESRSKTTLFIGTEGSVINRDDFNLPIGNIINSSNNSVFTEFYLKNFAEVLKHLGVNIDFSNNINVIDSLNLLNGFSDSKDKVEIQSKTIRKKLHNNKIISCFNFSDSLFFSNDSIAIDTLSKIVRPFEINSFFGFQPPEKVINEIINGKNYHHLGDFYSYNYGFKGLIFSPIKDTVSASAIKSIFDSGTDIFIAGNNLNHLLTNLHQLVEAGQIDIEEIDKKVKRILLAKKWTSPGNIEFKSAEVSLSKILDKQRMLLSWQLYESSVVLLKNEENLLPISDLLKKRKHLLTIGNSNFNELKENLGYYMDFSSSIYSKSKLGNNDLRYSNQLIIAIDNQQQELLDDSLFINKLIELDKNKKLIVIAYGNPNAVKKLSFADVLLYAYDTHPFSQANTAQIIVGALKPIGKIIPQSIAKVFDLPNFKTINRLRYTIPEAAGFNTYKLMNIDSLIDEAIFLGATPGAQILAAKNGKVFFYKSYGHQTYSKVRKVRKSDIYDLASISKVAATTLAAMKLYELDSINLKDSIKYLIDDTVNCTIKNHQLSDFFIHKTGLPPDMPILQFISYQDSVTERYDKYYAENKDSMHTIKVAENFYFSKDYLDTIILSLYNQEIDTTKPYIYSDINFNIIYDILLKEIPEPFEDFIYSNFYQPLQLRTMGFLPINKFSKYKIIPTQKDKYWRKELLRGTPHDESAAIYGGIAGNAGLFSNANDLAILFQMLINNGAYADKKVFQKETIEKFTLPQLNSKRGLGFNRKNGGLFGHSGFTGCVVWANPNTKFIFIFLSNSIHPRATNKRLKRMKIRSKAYDLIWNAYEPEKTMLIIE